MPDPVVVPSRELLSSHWSWSMVKAVGQTLRALFPLPGSVADFECLWRKGGQTTWGVVLKWGALEKTLLFHPTCSFLRKRPSPGRGFIGWPRVAKC